MRASTALAPAVVDPERLAAPGLRTFFRIVQAWGLDNDQARVLLGSPPRSTYFRWKKGQIGHVGQDLVERLSYVLGIYKALHILFPDPEQADAWLQRPNTAPLFGGGTALARMLGGQVADLFVVRQYLDGARG